MRTRPYRRYRLIYDYERPGQKSAVMTHVSFLLLLARPIRDVATSFRRFRQTEASCVEYRYEVTLHLAIRSTLELSSSCRPIPIKAKVGFNHFSIFFGALILISNFFNSMLLTLKISKLRRVFRTFSTEKGISPNWIKNSTG